jgi:hypothetical protein
VGGACSRWKARRPRPWQSAGLDSQTGCPRGLRGTALASTTEPTPIVGRMLACSSGSAARRVVGLDVYSCHPQAWHSQRARRNWYQRRRSPSFESDWALAGSSHAARWSTVRQRAHRRSHWVKTAMATTLRLAPALCRYARSSRSSMWHRLCRTNSWPWLVMMTTIDLTSPVSSTGWPQISQTDSSPVLTPLSSARDAFFSSQQPTPGRERAGCPGDLRISPGGQASQFRASSTPSRSQLPRLRGLCAYNYYRTQVTRT